MVITRPKPFKTFLTCHFCHKHSYSTAPYNAKKIRAFPFKMTPDHAKIKMAVFASYLNRDPQTKIQRHVLASTFLASWMKPWCRPPTRFSAVYFPCWYINADVHTKLLYKGKKETVNILFRNSYLPGSHVPLLSDGELVYHDMQDLVPFTTDLLRQHEMGVVPIPYSTSAIDLLDKILALNKDKSNVTIGDKKTGIVFDMGQLEIIMFATYPILMPVYIAEYEVEHKGKNVRMFMQAHEKKTPVICQTLQGVLSEEDEEDTRALNAMVRGYMRGEYVPIAIREQQAGQNVYAADKPSLKAFSDWLNMQLYKRIVPLASGEYNDHDPLVRPCTLDEKVTIDNYMDLAEEAIDYRIKIEQLEGDSQTHQDLSDTEFDRRRAVPRWWLKHRDTLLSR